MFKSVERKNPPTENSIFSKIILHKWKDKDFFRKRKPERIHCKQEMLQCSALQEVLKEVLQGEGKWYSSETWIYIREECQRRNKWIKIKTFVLLILNLFKTKL